MIIPGYSLGQLIQMTPNPHEPRSTAHSQKLRTMGRCKCGKPTNGKSLCAGCLKVQRDRMRERGKKAA
jgi:hypothetical protein